MVSCPGAVRPDRSSVRDRGGGGSNGGGSINVAIVDTPNTQDLAHLTPMLFTNGAGLSKRLAMALSANGRDGLDRFRVLWSPRSRVRVPSLTLLARGCC
jgi:hypothetical protein